MSISVFLIMSMRMKIRINRVECKGKRKTIVYDPEDVKGDFARCFFFFIKTTNTFYQNIFQIISL